MRCEDQTVESGITYLATKRTDEEHHQEFLFDDSLASGLMKLLTATVWATSHFHSPDPARTPNERMILGHKDSFVCLLLYSMGSLPIDGTSFPHQPLTL
jgi:hypothetical protein